jgi:hypothetical protein
MPDTDQLGCALLVEQGPSIQRLPSSAAEAGAAGPHGSFP